MSIFGTEKPFICEAAASLSGTASSGVITFAGSHGLVTDEYVYCGSAIRQITAYVDGGGIYTITVTPSPSDGAISVYKGYKFANSIFEFDLVQPDQLNFRSVINGNKTNTFLGDYGSFKITERLWQKITVFTAKKRFQRLNGFYHTSLWLFPHANKVIQDSATTTITCYFKGFTPMYYKGFSAYDAVVCEFETNKYHDVTKLLV